MSNVDIYFDITEFMQNPIRSGVQRVVFEFMKVLVSDDRVKFVMLEKNDFVVLPKRLVYFLTGVLFQISGANRWARFFLRRLFRLRLAKIKMGKDRLSFFLVAEVFFQPARLSKYANLRKVPGTAILVLAYDFLPMLQPHYFLGGATEPFEEYLAFIKKGHYLSFISKQVKWDFNNLFTMGDEVNYGQVIPLGADGLGRKSSGNTSKILNKYLVLGTLEPRKNIKRLLGVIKELKENNFEGNFLFIGYVGHIDLECRLLLDKLVEDGAIRVTANRTDEYIRNEIASSRALIFVSLAEGFGLPAIEGLYYGAPVIVGKDIPAIQEMEERGMIKVDPYNPTQIKEAILKMANDDFLKVKRQELDTLKLDTWSDIRKMMRDWVNESVSDFSLKNSAANSPSQHADGET